MTLFLELKPAVIYDAGQAARGGEGGGGDAVMEGTFSDISLEPTGSANFSAGQFLQPQLTSPLEDIDPFDNRELNQKTQETNVPKSDSILSQASNLTASFQQTLPTVASTVFSTFSNILKGAAGQDMPSAESNVDTSSINPSIHQQYSSPLDELYNYQMSHPNQVESVSQTPLFISPQDVPNPNQTVQSSVPQSGQNTFRLGGQKKKIYAPVPGLSTSANQASPMTMQNVPPTINPQQQELQDPPQPSFYQQSFPEQIQRPPSVHMATPTAPEMPPYPDLSYEIGFPQPQEFRQFSEPPSTQSSQSKFSLSSFFATPLLERFQGKQEPQKQQPEFFTPPVPYQNPQPSFGQTPLAPQVQTFPNPGQFNMTPSVPNPPGFFQPNVQPMPSITPPAQIPFGVGSTPPPAVTQNPPLISASAVPPKVASTGSGYRMNKGRPVYAKPNLIAESNTNAGMFVAGNPANNPPPEGVSFFNPVQSKSVQDEGDNQIIGQPLASVSPQPPPAFFNPQATRASEDDNSKNAVGLGLNPVSLPVVSNQPPTGGIFQPQSQGVENQTMVPPFSVDTIPPAQRIPAEFFKGQDVESTRNNENSQMSVNPNVDFLKTESVQQSTTATTPAFSFFNPPPVSQSFLPPNTVNVQETPMIPPPSIAVCPKPPTSGFINPKSTVSKPEQKPTVETIVQSKVEAIPTYFTPGPNPTPQVQYLNPVTSSEVRPNQNPGIDMNQNQTNVSFFNPQMVDQGITPVSFFNPDTFNQPIKPYPDMENKVQVFNPVPLQSEETTDQGVPSKIESSVQKISIFTSTTEEVKRVDPKTADELCPRKSYPATPLDVNANRSVLNDTLEDKIVPQSQNWPETNRNEDSQNVSTFFTPANITSSEDFFNNNAGVGEAKASEDHSSFFDSPPDLKPSDTLVNQSLFQNFMKAKLSATLLEDDQKQDNSLLVENPSRDDTSYSVSSFPSFDQSNYAEVTSQVSWTNYVLKVRYAVI